MSSTSDQFAMCRWCGCAISRFGTALGVNWVGGKRRNGLCPKAPKATGVHWPK